MVRPEKQFFRAQIISRGSRAVIERALYGLLWWRRVGAVMRHREIGTRTHIIVMCINAPAQNETSTTVNNHDDRNNNIIYFFLSLVKPNSVNNGVRIRV
jgi:hypothetical protein